MYFKNIDLIFLSNSYKANISSKGKTEVNSNTRVSFKGNPNAVDHTPTADTYQTQPLKEDSMLRTAAFIIPTWYGLNKGTDLFNKACGGEYEKSLMGRLGRFGDYLSGTRVFNNSVTRKMGSTWDNFKARLYSANDIPELTPGVYKVTASTCTFDIEPQFKGQIKNVKVIDKMVLGW